METNNINELAAALVAAQAELKNPPKTRTANAGKYKYTYADLADVADVVRPIFAKHGLAIVHLMQPAPGGGYMLLARILHKSGQSMDSFYPVPDGLGAQELGGWLTYMRRYSTCNLAFVAGETDDDGAGAQEAADSEEEVKKAEARERLKKMASEGRLKSAHDGHTIKPEEVAKTEPVQAEAAQGAAEASGRAPMDDALIDTRLRKLMARDKVTPSMVKAYYVKAGHKPDTVEPADLDDDYVELLTQSDNWAKAVKSMKGAK